LLEDLLRGGESVGRLRRRRSWQILRRVEASDRGNISDISQLEEIGRMLSELGDALIDKVRVEVVASSVVVPAAGLHSELLRHRRKSDSLGQVRKRINEVTLLRVLVEEAAAVAKLAFPGRLTMPELAWVSLVVRVNGAERGLAETLRQRIVRLSELLRPMCELAVFIEWAFSRLREVPAELRLVLLLERVEMSLVSVEIVVVRLLGQVPEHLLGRIVEIALLSGLVLVVFGLAGATVRGIRALGGRGFAFVALATLIELFALRLGRLGTDVGALTRIF